MEYHLEGFFVQVDLLITNCRPELNGLHGDVAVGVLHSQDGQLSTKSQYAVEHRIWRTTHPKQGLFHIETHVVVIVRHNRDEALEGGDLNGRAGVLCGFADNLHDVISLTLKRGGEN